MISLTDGLPSAIAVMGENLPVHCDFRRWILITKLFGEDALTPERKLGIAARIVLGQPAIQQNPAWMTAFGRGLMWFASCGDTACSTGSGAEPVFDFDADGDAIFAAFWQTYGIDLTETRMHWWKFNALLRSLPPETEFMTRVALRTLDLGRIEDDKTRKRLRQAKAKVRLKKR